MHREAETYIRVKTGINFVSFVSFTYGQWLFSEPRCSTHMQGEGWRFFRGEGGKQKSFDLKCVFFFVSPVT